MSEINSLMRRDFVLFNHKRERGRGVAYTMEQTLPICSNRLDEIRAEHFSIHLLYGYIREAQ